MNNLTEREIIRVLAQQFNHKSRLPLGFSDDVSAIPLSSKAWLIVKADMLVASTDVPPGMTTRELARKSIVATVSDFAAKGVRPLALIASLGLPAPARATKIQELARGLGQAAREYGCRIIGGDTNRAEDLVIDIAGVGVADPRKVVRRSGARPGDIVGVTGSFGRSAAGLKILLSNRKNHPARYRSLINAVRHPKAQLSTGIVLAKGGVTSSIDSSDGLALSLHQIAQASNVGIRLDTLPIAREVQDFAEEVGLSATDLALYGGEEYELVVTASPSRFAALKKRVRSLIEIGWVEPASRGLTVAIREKQLPIKERGWEHFPLTCRRRPLNRV